MTEKISVDSHPLQMETATREILTDKTINPVFQRAHNVRGWVDARAYEIKHKMALVSALIAVCFEYSNALTQASLPSLFDIIGSKTYFSSVAV